MSEQGPSIGVTRKVIEQAYAKASMSREEFLRRRSNNRVSFNFLTEFHSDIMNFWAVLRTYRDSDVIGDQWQSASIEISKEDLEFVTNDKVTNVVKIHGGGSGDGLDQLQFWLDAEAEVETKVKGTRGALTETKRVPVVIGPAKLLRIQSFLDDIARDLGFLPRPAEDTSLPVEGSFDQSQDEAEPSMAHTDFSGSPEL